MAFSKAHSQRTGSRIVQSRYDGNLPESGVAKCEPDTKRSDC
jgi:hypothetical protein